MGLDRNKLFPYRNSLLIEGYLEHYSSSEAQYNSYPSGVQVQGPRRGMAANKHSASTTGGYALKRLEVQQELYLVLATVKGWPLVKLKAFGSFCQVTKEPYVDPVFKCHYRPYKEVKARKFWKMLIRDGRIYVAYAHVHPDSVIHELPTGCELQNVRFRRQGGNYFRRPYVQAVGVKMAQEVRARTVEKMKQRYDGLLYRARELVSGTQVNRKILERDWDQFHQQHRKGRFLNHPRVEIVDHVPDWMDYR